MSFLDEAKRRIALAVKANESAPEPDSKERAFRKGMAAVLENIDAVDEKLVQEMMVVLMDNLERRFGGKQQEQQPVTNARKTPDLESYFTEPTRKTDARTPDIGSYFD
ncbi:hypothetical protein [Escherichia sp. MOD1-EC6099]|uniref:hypothetical protein n=1 Tax=Escherichia sp. MOD1-EC6099 TaxID=2093885 RepID=UPI000CF7A9D5|nr:hypothetical protein [Escherichia sp. MOD1-EC6099]